MMQKRNRHKRNNHINIQGNKKQGIFIKKDHVSIIHEDQIKEGKRMMEQERLENEKPQQT